PVVGSVRMLMNGRGASSSRIRPEEIFAICIRLTAPSCMRAPPEAETISKGWRYRIARSIARIIIFPPTQPLLPPIKRGSMAQILSARPQSRPSAAIIASLSLVACCMLFRRSLYGLLSTNPSGSLDRSSVSGRLYSTSSSSSFRRVTASMRLCAPHLGQTLQLLSRSLFQMIWRQPSHFCHRPSVRTLRSLSFNLGSSSSSPLSRLNQDIQALRYPERGRRSKCQLPLPWVGVAAQGREDAVNLFGQHGARQFVRERHGGHRHPLVRPRRPSGGQSVVSADQEHQVATLHFSFRDQPCDPRGIHRLAGRVEEDLAGGGMLLPQVCPVGTNLAHLTGRITRGAPHKIRRDGVGVGVLRLADEVEVDLHSGGIATCLPVRQR